MPDLRDILDAEARRVQEEPGSLGAVLDRASRRRRLKRVATGVLALAVAGAGFGLAYAAFRPAHDLRPGGPVPGPTPSPTTGPISGLVVVHDTDTQGGADFAAAMLAADGVTPEVIVVTQGRRPREVTTIHYHPSREAEALRLRDRFFQGAELRPRIDDTILITIGEDFLEANAALFDSFATVRSFMTRRVEGSGAEALLSDDAARQYATGRGGLSLYGYAEDPSSPFRITAISSNDDSSAVASVLVEDRTEQLTVGDTEGGRAEILAAELIEAPGGLAFEQVRAFVLDFLEARRLASGAGTYLGEDAREAYASHEEGLDLFRYEADEDLRFARIVKYDRLSPDRHRVVVLFVLSHPAPGEFEPQRVYEALTVERLGEDGLVVADAERAFFS